MVTLAAAACQPAPAIDLGLPGARPVSYAAIRDGSGVLGYAEPLLGPKLATRYQVPVGKGASAVEDSAVAGAWELPAGTTRVQVGEALRSKGAIDRVRDQSGDVWIADFRPRSGEAVRLLLIDGGDPAFARAAPEVRPGAHVYLIAYRL